MTALKCLTVKLFNYLSLYLCIKIINLFNYLSLYILT